MYILPLFDYGSCTWGATSIYNLDRILKLQKRAARIILNAEFDTASADMFQELGWAPIKKRHNYNKAVLTYKANLTPSYKSDLLIPVSQATIIFKWHIIDTKIGNDDIRLFTFLNST